MLLESGYVIPIGQVDNAQFYPQEIGNIIWADRISGFPKISEIKVTK